MKGKAEPATIIKDTFSKNGTWTLMQLDDEYSLGRSRGIDDKDGEHIGYLFYPEFSKEELKELFEMLKGMEEVK